jgi:transcriptional regulator with XRE-family HTH domain
MQHHIGFYLKCLRESKAGNVTQSDVAEASGLAKDTISRIERESHEPGWETVYGILRALGVDLVAFGNFITEIDEKGAVNVSGK